MKAEELRIGNWVNYNENIVMVEEITFSKINSEDVIQILGGLEYYLQEIKPEQITSKILEKFGF